MSMFGIDVSEHNGVLDWGKIKAAGVEFAVIRSGYGVSHVDTQFARNMRGAIAQGIPVGIYHFSYALSAEGAKKEGEFVLSLLEPYRGEIVLPVFFDFEYDTVTYAKKQGVNLGKSAFLSHTEAFCKVIKGAGYTPGVYYNLDYYRNYVEKDRFSGLVIWYAQYASRPTVTDYDLWQYSSSYTIPGHSGRFDANILETAALLEPEKPAKKYTLGWHRDSLGWWYADSESSYYRGRWAKIGGDWYDFDEKGYMLMDTWKMDSTGTYYLGADGKMQTNMLVGLGADGKLRPMERYIRTLADVPAALRAETETLISEGKLKGKGGEGEDLVLDISEGAIRAMIVMNRRKE